MMVMASSGSGAWERHGEACCRFPDETAARRWFRGLLWQAFPAAQTDHDLARRAAATLEVSESRVRGWLRCEHDAKLREVLRVLALAGASVVLPDDGGEG
ncbi:hypothetical protein [Rubellimicrobium sp. CFH 75288]|uniref:hypothetical protein n=1 Tax=Rubellimicrobium sp. CFH 75288 TaxID=2697034 RepID=UPI00352B2A1D